MSKPRSRPSAGQFVPYASEADVLRIGGLQVENRLDRITISGDVDLTLDQAGLALARELQRLLGAVVDRLEGERELPERLPAPQVQKVANPFG